MDTGATLLLHTRSRLVMHTPSSRFLPLVLRCGMLLFQDCPLCQHPGVPLHPVAHRSFGSCPTCGGIFVDKPSLLEPAEELAEYTSHQNDVHDPRFRNFVRPLVEVIASRHDQTQSGLDFGAGFAPVASTILAEQGYAVTLYDPYFHPDESVLHRQYDFILCCEVIEHFYRPSESFRLLASLLAPGGSLYCRTTLIPDHIPFERWHYKNEDTHVFFYDRRSITWIAEHIMHSSCTIIDKNILFFTKSGT